MCLQGQDGRASRPGAGLCPEDQFPSYSQCFPLLSLLASLHSAHENLGSKMRENASRSKLVINLAFTPERSIISTSAGFKGTLDKISGYSFFQGCLKAFLCLLFEPSPHAVHLEVSQAPNQPSLSRTRKFLRQNLNK